MAAPQPMFLGSDFKTEHKTSPKNILDEDFQILDLIERESPYKKAKGLNLKKVKRIIKIGLGTLAIGVALIQLKNYKNDMSGIETGIGTGIETNVDDFRKLSQEQTSKINIVETAIAPIEIENEIVENEPVISKTYDFSFEGRSKDVPTREYKVTSSYENNISSELNNLINKYSTMYGIDPCLFRALCTQESSLNHVVDDSRTAIGICQIEKTNFGDTEKAYNYQTNTEDHVEINYNNVANLETNMQLGAMKLQNKLNKYGDLNIAIQSYNYGEAMMDHLINLSGLENPTYQQMLPLINDVHNNPNKYINNWEYSTYGDNKYPQHVFRNHPGNTTYYNIDKNIVIQDVDKNEKIGVYSVVSNENNEWILEDNLTGERIKLENISISLNKGYAK